MKTFRTFVAALLLSCLPAFGQAISSSGTINTNTIGVFLDAKHLKGAAIAGGVTYDGTTLTFGVGTNLSILGVNGTSVSGGNITNSLGMVWGNVGTNITGFPTNIADAQIVSGAAIARDKIANGTPDHIVINSVGGALSSEATLGATRFPALTGDITTPGGSLATSLANNSVTDTKLRDSAGFSVIGKFNTGSGDPADIAAGTDSVFGRIGSGNLGFAKVNTNQISAANASAGQVIGFDGSVVVWTNPPASGGTSFYVGTTNVSNPSLSGTTPAAPTNGKLVGWQTSGTNVSAALVGNGNSGTSLDGTGAYSTPAGGSAAAFNGVIPSSPQNITNTTTMIWGVSGTNVSGYPTNLTDSQIASSGVTTRSKLPSAIAYEDEANSFSGNNIVTGTLRVTGSYQYGWTDLGSSTNITGATNALFKVLTGNLILTNSIRDNENVRLHIGQDSTGSRTLSIDNVSAWIFNTNQSSTMPSVNTNAGRTTIVDLWRVNGTNYGALVTASSVFSAALNDIVPSATGGQLIGFNTNSMTPSILSLSGLYVSNNIVYSTAVGSGSGGGTNYTLDTTQFSLGAGDTNLSVKSGSAQTNVNFKGPMVFAPSSTDSTNINWSVGQNVIQGITTNASFTNKFTGTNPVAGASVVFVVYNNAATNISVIFDAYNAPGLTNYYYNTGTSNVASVAVSSGTRSSFYWYYDGGRYYLNVVEKNLKVTDAALSSAWDGDTGTAPSRNATYDYFHLFIPDDNGKINLSGTTTNAGVLLTPKVNLLVTGTNLIVDLSLSHFFDVLLTNANPALLSFTNSPGTNNLATYVINIFQDSSGSRILNVTNLLTIPGHATFTLHTNAGAWNVLSVIPNPRTNGYYGGTLTTNL